MGETDETVDCELERERHALQLQAREEAKRVLEAILFASNEPISFIRLRHIANEVHPFKPKELRQMLDEMAESYTLYGHAFQLEEIAEGYLLRTRREYGFYLDQFFHQKKSERLSQAATEVLAIIAYRQPITRPQIEALRGVDSSGVVHSLLERELIHAIGKLEVPGRPTLYGVTKQFLEHFGLKNIEDLPSPATS